MKKWIVLTLLVSLRLSSPAMQVQAAQQNPPEATATPGETPAGRPQEPAPAPEKSAGKSQKLAAPAEKLAGDAKGAAIPNKAQWESKMLTLAQKYADFVNNKPLVFSLENQVWYYDGARVFFQIADYTKDPKWNDVAYKILDQYEDFILKQPPKAAFFGHAYRMFPYGILMAYQRTAGTPAQEKHRQALEYLYANETFTTNQLRYLVSTQTPHNPTWLRESAYVLDLHVAHQMATGVKSPMLHSLVYDAVMADLTEWMTPGSDTYLGKTFINAKGKEAGYINNFMVGLALESLIHYYEMTLQEGKPDEAVPPFIGKVLDFFYANSVDHASGAMFYNSDPINGKCPDEGNPMMKSASSLNQLVAPAYAWYGLRTGQAKYSEIADKLFAAGVQGAKANECSTSIKGMDYSWDGKQFSQNYKWSFDYIRWRSGVEPSTIEAPRGKSQP